MRCVDTTRRHPIKERNVLCTMEQWRTGRHAIGFGAGQTSVEESNNPSGMGTPSSGVGSRDEGVNKLLQAKYTLSQHPPKRSQPGRPGRSSTGGKCWTKSRSDDGNLPIEGEGLRRSLEQNEQLSHNSKHIDGMDLGAAGTSQHHPRGSSGSTGRDHAGDKQGQPSGCARRAGRSSALQKPQEQEQDPPTTGERNTLSQAED